MGRSRTVTTGAKGSRVAGFGADRSIVLRFLTNKGFRPMAAIRAGSL
jgi:hypothetical protein